MKKTDSYRMFLGLRVSAWIEMITFFLITTLIAFFNEIQFNFFSASFHPFWIIVILISAQYGTSEGLVAALCATAILLLGPLPIRTVLQDRFEYLFFLIKTPLLWFVSATILGEICMRHVRERDRLKQSVEQTEEREKKIAESYNSLKKIKENLEMRVASEMQTTLMAIDAFRKLEQSGKEGIIQGAIELTKVLIAPEQFSIFLLQEGKLKRVAYEGWIREDQYAQSIGFDSPLFQEIVEKNRVVVISTTGSKIIGNEGVMAVPISEGNGNTVIGMIKVEQIPFLRLRTTTIESLHSIGKWIGTAYAHLSKEEEK